MDTSSKEEDLLQLYQEGPLQDHLQNQEKDISLILRHRQQQEQQFPNKKDRSRRQGSRLLGQNLVENRLRNITEDVQVIRVSYPPLVGDQVQANKIMLYSRSMI